MKKKSIKQLGTKIQERYAVWLKYKIDSGKEKVWVRQEFHSRLEIN